MQTFSLGLGFLIQSKSRLNSLCYQGRGGGDVGGGACVCGLSSWPPPPRVLVPGEWKVEKVMGSRPPVSTPCCHFQLFLHLSFTCTSPAPGIFQGEEVSAEAYADLPG